VTVTYTNDPGGVPVDHVRLLIGDTDCTAWVARLSDEEIQFRLDSETGEELAAWRCCQDIVAQLSGTAVNFSAGAQTEARNQLIENYRKLMVDLRTRGAGEFAAIEAGGIIKSDKQANEDDSTIVQGTFRSNQLRNRRRGNAHPQTSLKEVFD